MFFRRRSHAVDGAYGSGENMWDGTRILVHSGSMGRTFVGGRTLEGGRLQPRTWLLGCSTLHGGFCRFYTYGMYSLGFTSCVLNGLPHHGLQEQVKKMWLDVRSSDVSLSQWFMEATSNSILPNYPPKK